MARTPAVSLGKPLLNSEIVTVKTAWRNPNLSARFVETDGLRGLAILLVVGWHYFLAVQGPGASLESTVILPLRLIWTAVDLFFVLSGFFIGGILYDTRYSERFFYAFYWRRGFRVFPLYLAWTLLFFLGIILTSGPSSGEQWTRLFSRNVPAWSYLLMVQNFAMAWMQDGGATWMGITWSLAVEWQFYLLCPLVMWRRKHKSVLRWTLLAVALAPAVRIALWLTGNKIVGPYTLLPCRMDSLGLGVVVALVCRDEATWNWLLSHRRLLWAWFGILNVGMLLMAAYPRGTVVLGLTLADLFYSTALLLAIMHPGLMARLGLGNRWLVQLGTIAYGVYLTHQGTDKLLHALVADWQTAGLAWVGHLATFAGFVLTIALSAASWRYLERPLMEYARTRFTYQQRSVPAPAMPRVDPVPMLGRTIEAGIPSSS